MNWASTINSRAAELDRMCCNWWPREAVLIGTDTAPIQAQPRKARKKSSRFEQISATRSPRLMPAVRKVAPNFAASSRVCA